MGCTEALVRTVCGLWGLMNSDWLQHRKFSIQEQKKNRLSMFPQAFLDLFNFNVFVMFFTFHQRRVLKESATKFEILFSKLKINRSTV